MQGPGTIYGCYVLDTQLLFPLVFLKGILNLSSSNTLYQNCVGNLFENKFRVVILPSVDSEFIGLILEKYRNLLEDIKWAALRCKPNETKSFCYKVEDLIHSKDYPEDFKAYWLANKNSFSDWLGSDKDSLRKKTYGLIRDVLEEYQEVISHAEVMKKWANPQHEQESREICTRLKNLKDVEKVVPAEAHEQDLNIISDCIVYCNHFSISGIIYLITNDKSCYETVKAITNPKLGRGIMIDRKRFDSIRPDVVLDRLNKLKTPKQPK